MENYACLLLDNGTCWNKSNYTKNVCILSVLKKQYQIPGRKTYADQCYEQLVKDTPSTTTPIERALKTE
jgi:hypothetical protein